MKTRMHKLISPITLSSFIVLMSITATVHAEYYVVYARSPSTVSCRISPPTRPVILHPHKHTYVMHRPIHHRIYHHSSVTPYYVGSIRPSCPCAGCDEWLKAKEGKGHEPVYYQTSTYTGVLMNAKVESCYDPDLSTVDDNACEYPDMQVTG